MLRDGRTIACPKQNNQYSERKNSFPITKSAAAHYLPKINRAGTPFYFSGCCESFHIAFILRASHATKAMLLAVVLYAVTFLEEVLFFFLADLIRAFLALYLRMNSLISARSLSVKGLLLIIKSTPSGSFMCPILVFEVFFR
jgi:hypothetical protein